MSSAYGIHAIKPVDATHVLGFASARGSVDDSLLEVWNASTNSGLVFTLDKAGQLQGASGTAARPTYSFEADKDSGRYMSGAGTFLDVVGGTAVGTWTAGKLTLVELQVDNLNLNGNTLSSTAGTDLLITPLAGQQIVLDGTIVIDAGVVTGATSITSTAFVGDVTGDLTGTADVATVATTVTITDNESTSEANAVIFTAGGDLDGGNLGLESDGTFNYNPSSGTVTATAFAGALNGIVGGSTPADGSFTTLSTTGALTAGASVYINDTANANQTLGLTINQGANDNEIIAFKSSDVAHGRVGYAETDTFFSVKKGSAAYGGVTLRALAEDAAMTTPFTLVAHGGTANTTKSAAGRALIELVAVEHDGADSDVNTTADGNVLGVLTRVGGDTYMRWLVDEDGDTWQAGNVLLDTGSVINFGGNVTITHSTGALTIAGATTTTLNGTVSVGNNFSIAGDVTGVWKVTNTSQSTGVAVDAGTTTGALRSHGGLGVVKNVYYGGILVAATVTTLANDGTPTVAASNLFKTGGTTTITDFDDGVVGQTISIIAAHAITITDGSPIILHGSANFVMAAADTLTLTMFDDQVWQEVSRMVN